MTMIKDIPGYPGYKADSDGNIWGIRGRCLKWQYTKSGYPRVTVGHNTKCTVHILVCLAFYGPRPSGLEIRHLDSNKNNSNPNNLRYGTSRENANDTIGSGSNRGSNNGHSKLTEEDVIEIRNRYRTSRGNQIELAKQYNVTQSCIHYALEGKIIWKHVPNPCRVNTRSSRSGSRPPHAKLNDEKVIEIRKRVENGESNIIIAKDYGVTPKVIWNIQNKRTYKS